MSIFSLSSKEPIPILMAAINAKYIHSALSLYCLKANLGHLQNQAQILEFDIHRRPSEIAEQILQYHPRILALSLYLWNVELAHQTLQLIRKIDSSIKIILGGPEISYPADLHPISELADYILCGEGEIAFRELCQKILTGQIVHEKIIISPQPNLEELQLPYDLYNEDSILHRILYIETSRGCPFGCQFCLSSLDNHIRYFKRSLLFSSLEKLLARGAKQFKFIDRTFNTHTEYAAEILQFFLNRLDSIGSNLFLHFEAVPHLLPEPIRRLLPLFPPGTIQLEIGIQTLNSETSRRISRAPLADYSQYLKKIEDNIRWLRLNTGVHLHTDLIAGLPGETIMDLAHSFNTLLSWDPQEIQVGILKRLRGAPIDQHTHSWQMVYSPYPPYEILKNKTLSYEETCNIKRFARFWDLISNSGRFIHTTPLILNTFSSPFHSFMQCTKWLFHRLGCQSEIALPRLATLLEEYLSQNCALPREEINRIIENDLSHSRKKQKEKSAGHTARQIRRSSSPD